jgi:hypothetical protein
VHIDSAFGKRDCDPPGPHGKFEHRSGASVLGEERDGALRIKSENFWPLVVDIGKAVAVADGPYFSMSQILRPAGSVEHRRPSASLRLV